jgi:hypothetical protein
VGQLAEALRLRTEQIVFQSGQVLAWRGEIKPWDRVALVAGWMAESNVPRGSFSFLSFL